MLFIQSATRPYLLLSCCVLLGACSAILRDPVPAKDYLHTTVLGREDLRMWGDQQEPREYPSINPSDPKILQRQFSGIMHTEHNYLAISGGGADAYRIAATTHRDGVALELTWIPMGAPEDPGEQLFDPAYMSALFDYGYQRVVNGSAWSEVDITKIDPTRGN